MLTVFPKFALFKLPIGLEYGTSLNRARRAALAGPVSSGLAAEPTAARGRCDQTWAMLIKRVYEVDPLACPQCGGMMKVIAFIEPPQGTVIEKILRHCGLWRESLPRPPPADEEVVYVPDEDFPPLPSDRRTPFSEQPGELTFVDMDTFWATF